MAESKVRRDLCPHCHNSSSYVSFFECSSCGTVFCGICAKRSESRKALCPTCGNTGRKVYLSDILEREAEAKKRAEVEAKRRAEEEAKRRAETLRELENRQYGLGLRIGNRYYSDYED